MELFNRVYEGLVNRRERVLTGKINCIPFGLPRFERELPGIERERYYLISANQKVGKTKVTNFLFLFNPVFYAYNNKDKIKLKIFYFSLEISTEELYQEFICHLLYVLSKGKVRIDVKDLKSTSNLKPLPEEILELMNSDLYKSYFQFFEECVEIHESIRNPFGIYKMMRDYAHSNGIQHKKRMIFVDNKTGEESYQEVDDLYEPNNPDEYVLGIVDNINLLFMFFIFKIIRSPFDFN